MSHQQPQPEGEASSSDLSKPSAKTRKLFFVYGLLTLLVTLTFTVWYQQSRNLCIPDPEQFEQAKILWRKGQLTILVRHTEKCSAVPDACDEGSKGITPRGFEQAKMIGAAISTFGPAVNRVLYSPTDRTQQTALAAFTKANGTELSPENWLVGECKKNFAAQIKAEKRAGENLILVTHSSCLNSLQNELSKPLLPFNAGKDKYFGVALLFGMPETGPAKYLTCALPSNWPGMRR